MKTTKAILTIEMELALNGESEKATLQRLMDAGMHLFSKGFITGDGPAEVERHEIKAAIVEPVDEDKIADFVLGQIESGALPLEDIPNRLVRHGLMNPQDFIAEMKERMNEPGAAMAG
jgi:hypothetical protein